MAYNYQSFVYKEALTSAKMNLISDNIRDHVHGAGGVAELSAYARLADAETITGNWIFAPSSGDTKITAGNVAIGANITPDTNLHVYRGSAGTVSAQSNAGVAIEDDTSVYLQFLTPNNMESGIIFGDPEQTAVGYVVYNHVNNDLTFQTNGLQKVSINSSGQLVSGLATGTAPLSVASTTKVTNLNVDLLGGYSPGNNNGNIPISNGTVNTNLNADMVDGYHAGNGTGAIPVSNGTVNVNLNAEQHNGLKVIVVDIGDWNMISTTTKSVAHGLTLTKIRNVEVLIRDDTDAIRGPITAIGTLTDVDGNYYADGTNVVMQRRVGGSFDSASYDATTYNRGWITIFYVP